MIGYHVEAFNRPTKPEEGKTIADDIEIDEISKICSLAKIYIRDKKICPLGRGNWVIDFHQDDKTINPILCLKMPMDMTRENIEKWLEPLKIEKRYL